MMSASKGRGAAKRRARAGADNAERRFETRLRQFHGAPGGLYELVVFAPSDAFAVIARAATGDAMALWYAQKITSFVDEIDRAPRHRQTLCFTCDTALSARLRPAMVALLHPHAGEVRHTLAFGFCPACVERFSDRGKLIAATCEGLSSAFSNLRVVSGPVFDVEGHA